MTTLDEDGGPIIPFPPPPTIASTIFRVVILHCLVPVVVPVVLAIQIIKGKLTFGELVELIRIVNKGHADPIDKLPCNNDKELLKKLWKLPSAKHYLKGGLEYQVQEGYCGKATERCILKSMEQFPKALLPEQKNAESNPVKWCAGVEALVKDVEDVAAIKTDVVPGDVPFEKFVETLKKVNDDTTRLAVNYLRPALTGYKFPKWLPTHFILGAFGGHFSPIIGMLTNDADPKDPLVGVFDVNHKYGGAYLVPASRLHASVKAIDVSTRSSRALVVVEMP